MHPFTIKYRAEFTAYVDIESENEHTAFQEATKVIIDDAWCRIGPDADLPNIEIVYVRPTYPAKRP